MKIKYSLCDRIYVEDYLLYTLFVNMKPYFFGFRTWKKIFFITRATDMNI